MANHISYFPGAPRPRNDNNDSNDEQVTFSEFLGTPEWPQPADFERRQRRRTEADVPPQYRRIERSDRSTGASLLHRPPTTSTMQDAPSLSSSRPPPPQPSSMPVNTIRERGSLEPLPRWQPDHEVNACPVCKTTFSFFFRKHHCRKCGRVVCNNCSPHRITIPRQYVVQPPTGEDAEVSEAYPARNLGGGEVVRVCNPCVPDPWTPERSFGAREASEQARAREISVSSASEGSTTRVPQRYRIHGGGPIAPLPPPGGRMRAQSHQPTPYFSSRSLPGGPPQTPAHFGGRRISESNATASSSRPRHRYTQSSANAPPPYQTYDPRVRPLSAAVATGSSNPPPYRQRRQVREEDECPVCGEELPPGDDIRKTHIEECIITRFGTPNPPTTLNSGTPNDRTSTPPTSTRPRASTYRPRGMAVYKATEKDCMDANSETQECVICFEEFQPGDEMGRMECLCKFHRACIRQWWETKGAGSCPTHQLHSQD